MSPNPALICPNFLEPPKSLREKRLIEEAGQILHNAYGMFDWWVETTNDGGSCLVIRNLDMWGKPGIEKFGYVIPINKLDSAKERRRKILWAGGELIERAWANVRTGQRSRNEVDTS